MVPRMQQHPLRPHNCYRALPRNLPRKPQRSLHDLRTPARDDTRHEPHAQRVLRGEVARAERELPHEALVPRDLGEARERAYVGCEAYVDFLRRCHHPYLIFVCTTRDSP